MKTIKLHPAASNSNTKLSGNARYKGQSYKLRTFLVRLLIILCLAVVSGITIMAFFSDEVLFENLLTGLFIVGCLLFIKAISDEKTDVRGVKRNIHK
jgi:hypothetical protein